MTETSHSTAGSSAPDLGPAPAPQEKRSGGPSAGGRKIGIGAVVALAVLVGFVVWLVIDSQNGSSSKDQNSSVATVSEEGAKTLATTLNQPVYWVGRQPGTQLELTQLPNGRIFVRYLPIDAKAGDKGAYLTIGTYAMKNAFSVVQKGSKEQGAVPVTVAGGVGLYRSDNRHSVYVAYPGSDYQIEVYAPDAELARSLVKANRVSSIATEGSASGSAKGPSAVSVARLKALSASLGQPIYWAGSQENVKYELTQTANGRIFIRYLPPGVAAGAHALYLTVGTYLVANAFAVTKRAGQAADTASVILPDGAVAIYKKRNSTHVYLAYPGSDQQIEVFDPTPDNARRLVAAARITPVR